MSDGIYLLQDECFRNHRTGSGHPETPRRLEYIDRGLAQKFPEALRVEPRPARQSELTVVHESSYIDQVEEVSSKGALLEADTPTSVQSYETALLAVGGSLNLGERVSKNNLGGFGAVRPPGHHATPNRGMGFCLFNNLAIVAEYFARRDDSVAIVDIDCHHGNGTQEVFYNRSDVLYVSFHQHPFYPGTGSKVETGSGDGEGYTLNVNLSAGEGWEELKSTWKQEVYKKLSGFNPDVLLVSAGFDAHRADPIGGLNFEDEDYEQIGSDLADWAEEFCDGRRLGLLEGGYDLGTLQRVVPTFVNAFCG